MKFVALGLVLSLTAVAKISSNVPADLPNYFWLGQLEAYGCARPTFRAFQPQPHDELRESVLSTDGEQERCQAPEWLLRERAILLTPSRTPEFRASTFVFHDDTIALPGLNASVTPLFPLRHGRPTFNGPNLYGEFLADLAVGRKDFGFALSVTPGWVGAVDDYRHFDGRFYLYEGYLKVGYHRLEVMYGRTALGFGDAQHGSLFLSGGAKPLNLWKIGIRPSSETSSIWGPFSLETWITEDDQAIGINKDKLWGIGLGIRPWDPLELAILEVYQFGGLNAPGLTSSDYFQMLYYSGDPTLDAKRHRGLAMHVGVWGPQHFVKGYAQLFFEKLRAPHDWFFNDVSLLVGAWLPKLDGAQVRVEYVRTASNAYSNPIWTQGWTFEGTPLGHPLGNDGEAAYLDANFGPLMQWRPGLGLFYEARGKTGALVRPAEWRYGLTGEMRRRWSSLEMAGNFAFARVLNHGNEEGSNINAAAAMLTLRYSFL